MQAVYILLEWERVVFPDVRGCLKEWTAAYVCIPQSKMCLLRYAEIYDIIYENNDLLKWFDVSI